MMEMILLLCSRWRWRNIRLHWRRSAFWWSPRTSSCSRVKSSQLQWRTPRNARPCSRKWAGLFDSFSTSRLHHLYPDGAMIAQLTPTTLCSQHGSDMYFLSLPLLPSVLWCCWLGGRKGIPPVNNLSGGCWCGYLPGARCTWSQFVPLNSYLLMSANTKHQVGWHIQVPFGVQYCTDVKKYLFSLHLLASAW